MSKGQQRSGREAEKPKKTQAKATASAPSRFLEVPKATTPARAPATRKA